MFSTQPFNPTETIGQTSSATSAQESADTQSPNATETSSAVQIGNKEDKLTPADELLKNGIIQNNLSMVQEALTKGADSAKRDKYKKSLFDIAITNAKDINIIRALLVAGAKMTPGQFGFMPIHEAAYLCKLPLIELLLEFKADINSKALDGSTPLHSLCDGPITDPKLLIPTAERLIKAGADVNSLDERGNNPMRIAAYWGLYELTKFLITAGSECSRKKFTSPSPLTRGNEQVGGIIAKAIQEIASEQQKSKATLKRAT